MKDPLLLEDFGERRIIVNLMVALHNHQASKVGINQILNSFMSDTVGFFSHKSLSQDANNIFDDTE